MVKNEEVKQAIKKSRKLIEISKNINYEALNSRLDFKNEIKEIEKILKELKQISKNTIDITAITKANEKVKGTKDYNKYNMEMHSKIDGVWKFIGWYIPHESIATIKKFKDNRYLMTNNGNTRYIINEAVAELLNIDMN